MSFDGDATEVEDQGDDASDVVAEFDGPPAVLVAVVPPEVIRLG